MTYVKGCWGKSPVQRLNVTNTNGVHFPKVSGNQELLTLNCGEHKPKTRVTHMKATAAKQGR